MASGRLIYPFLIELAPLDTLATQADPDGAGPLTSGYDDDFREPVMVSQGVADQTGTSARVEGTPIQVKAQIVPDQFEQLQAMISGQSPESNAFRVILHYKDLAALGLVDASGKPTINKSDRLTRILDLKGNLVETIPDPPGLYVHQIMSRGWGLGGSNPSRNLLFVDFQERAQSVASSG